MEDSGMAAAVVAVEEEEKRLIERVDFDMLCSTVAMKSNEGKWNKLEEMYDEELGGGVFRMWEGDVLDCFDDRESVLQSSFCPWYRFGENMRLAGFGSCFLQGFVYIILAAIAICNFVAFTITNKPCFLYLGVAFALSLSAYLGFHRSKMRQKFNIKSHNLSTDLIFPDNKNTRKYIMFKSIFKGLEECPLSYAISANPEIVMEWVAEFWNKAEIKHNALGDLQIVTEVKGQAIKVNEEKLRTVLRTLDDKSHPWKEDWKPADLSEMLTRMGYEGEIAPDFIDKSRFHPYWKFVFHVISSSFADQPGGFDKVKLEWAGVMQALTKMEPYNYSKQILRGMWGHIKLKNHTKWIMYPRFVQLLIEDHFSTLKAPILRTGKTEKMRRIGFNSLKHMAESRLDEELIAIPLEKFGRFDANGGVVIDEQVAGKKRVLTLENVSDPEEDDSSLALKKRKIDSGSVSASTTPPDTQAMPSTSSPTTQTILTPQTTQSPTSQTTQSPTPKTTQSSKTTPSPSKRQKLIGQKSKTKITFKTKPTSSSPLTSPITTSTIPTSPIATSTIATSTSPTPILPQFTLPLITPPLTTQPSIIPAIDQPIYTMSTTTSTQLPKQTPSPRAKSPIHTSPRPLSPVGAGTLDQILARLSTLEKINRSQQSRDLKSAQVMQRHDKEIEILQADNAVLKKRVEELTAENTKLKEENSSAVSIREVQGRKIGELEGKCATLDVALTAVGTSIESVNKILEEKLVSEFKKVGKDVGKVYDEVEGVKADLIKAEDRINEKNVKTNKRAVRAYKKAKKAILKSERALKIAKATSGSHITDALKDAALMLARRWNWEGDKSESDKDDEDEEDDDDSDDDDDQDDDDNDQGNKEAQKDKAIDVDDTETGEAGLKDVSEADPQIGTSGVEHSENIEEQRDEEEKELEEEEEEELLDYGNSDKDENPGDDDDGAGGGDVGNMGSTTQEDPEGGDENPKGLDTESEIHDIFDSLLSKGAGTEVTGSSTVIVGPEYPEVEWADPDYVQEPAPKRKKRKKSSAIASAYDTIMVAASWMITTNPISGRRDLHIWRTDDMYWARRKRNDNFHNTEKIYYVDYNKFNSRWVLRRVSGELTYLKTTELHSLSIYDLNYFAEACGWDRSVNDLNDWIKGYLFSQSKMKFKDFTYNKGVDIELDTKYFPFDVDFSTPMPRRGRLIRRFRAPKHEAVIKLGTPFEKNMLTNFEGWRLDNETGHAVIYRSPDEQLKFFDEHELIRFEKEDLVKLYESPCQHMEDGYHESVEEIVGTFNWFVRYVVVTNSKDLEHFMYSTK